MVTMLKTLLWLITRFALLAMVFLACGVVAVWQEWPRSAALYLAAGIVVAYLALNHAALVLREHREEARIAKTRAGNAATRAFESEKAANMRLTWKSGLAFLDSAGSKRAKSARALPWFLFMGSDGDSCSKIVGLADVPEAEPKEQTDNPDFSWHFARNAVWLDLDSAPVDEDGARWRLFLAEYAVHQASAPLEGMAYALDCERLLDNDDAALKREAGLLRARLDQLIRLTGIRLPIYVLVDRIDLLYGMRSLTAGLSPDDRKNQLGLFRREEGYSPRDFVSRAIKQAVESLGSARMRRRELPPDSLNGPEIDPAAAAAFQATGELHRLEKPLTRFFEGLFGENPYQMIPRLGGVFFGSSEPSGETLAPLFFSAPAIHRIHEEVDSSRPWFWEELLAKRIPESPARGGHIGHRLHARTLSANVALSAFLCGTLVLCWLMTLSFAESQSVLRSVAGKIGEPQSAKELRPLLALTMETGLRNARWRLPRFGMNEEQLAEAKMRRRFLGSYAQLRILPMIGDCRARAAAAIKSGASREIGDTLLSVAALRQSLSRIINPESNRPSGGALFDRSSISDDDRIQLEMYERWATKEAWMPQAVGILVALERQILTQALDGDVMRWLPDWAESRLAMPALNTASMIWDPIRVPAANGDSRIIRPAWTYAGYKRASDLLEAVAFDESDDSLRRAKRENLLAAYRHEARMRWQKAAGEIWRGYRQNIGDSDLIHSLNRVAAGDGPAFRMARLLLNHLAPMFPPDERDPDIVWLREMGRLLSLPDAFRDKAAAPGVLSAFGKILSDAAEKIGVEDTTAPLAKYSGSAADGVRVGVEKQWEALRDSFASISLAANSSKLGLESVRAEYLRSMGMSNAPGGRNPFDDAKNAARALAAHLHRVAPSAAWSNISPVAAYNYMRYLATRRAALHLDSAWREKVYAPSRIMGGAEKERFAEITKPGGMLETFLGTTALGLWRMENGALVNSEWDKLPFMFNPAFLDYASWAINSSRLSTPEKMVLPFRLDAVSVDADARERPVRVDIVLNEKGAGQILTYRNYPVTTAFSWNMEPSATIEVTIAFPSFEMIGEFAGPSALGDFVKAFASGTWTLTPDAFPRHRDALRRIGVGRISIRATLMNEKEFLDYFSRASVDMPASIISSAGGNAPPNILPPPAARSTTFIGW